MNDQIADLLIRIKNGNAVKKILIPVPYSKMKEAIVLIIKNEGYIRDFKISEKKNIKMLDIFLSREKPLSHIKQISKPGQRIYSKAKDIPKPLRGLGLVIISTPKGVICATDARKAGLGGELICEIW